MTFPGTPGALRALILAAGLLASAPTLSAPADEAAAPPPTVLDLIPLLHGGEAEPQELADRLLAQGVLANMRVPPEHLRVAFTDSRTGEPLTRDDRRHILGQSRQDAAWQLIEQVFELFPVPGGFSTETLLDLFDAAALASMRRPPPYLQIEFYDERTGPGGSGRGGVSGEVPDFVYQPEAGLQSKDHAEPAAPIPPPAEDTDRRRQALSDRVEAWPEERFVRQLLDEGFRFSPRNDREFLTMYYNFASDPAELRESMRHDLRQLRQRLGRLGSALDYQLADRTDPFLHIVAGERWEDETFYAALVVMEGERPARLEHDEVLAPLYE